jgi:hypothetical protein
MNLAGNWPYLEKVAEVRLTKNKTPDHVYRYGPEIEVMGAAGEVIARRILGLPELLHTGWDGGSDLSWRNWRVDIKTTRLTPRLEYRYLQWRENKKLKADLVLMIAVDVQEKKGVPVGWAWKKEVLAAPVNRERYQACHEIPVPDLHPIWMLETIPWKRR